MGGWREEWETESFRVPLSWERTDFLRVRMRIERGPRSGRAEWESRWYETPLDPSLAAWLRVHFLMDRGAMRPETHDQPRRSSPSRWEV